jgi:hypothetical protein
VRQRQSVAVRQGCKHEHLGPGHAKRADKGGRAHQNNLACPGCAKCQARPTGAVALGVVVLKASKKGGGAGGRGGGGFLVASPRSLQEVMRRIRRNTATPPLYTPTRSLRGDQLRQARGAGKRGLIQASAARTPLHRPAWVRKAPCPSHTLATRCTLCYIHMHIHR